MPIDQSTKRYLIAAGGILLLTAAGMAFLISQNKSDHVEQQTSAVDDVLNNAVITAYTEAHRSTNNVTTSSTNGQTGTQTHETIEHQNTNAAMAPQPTAETSPEREGAILPITGPQQSLPPVEGPEKPTHEGPTGTLPREVIREGILSMRPIVEQCYRDTLRDFPDAEGKVTISFTISAEEDEGRVQLAELDPETTTLIDSMLHDCMLESIGELRFPAPDGDGTVNVKYPFQFSSVADDTHQE